MTTDAYRYPVAIARLSEGETSREPQNIRAIEWLLSQPGGSVLVVTPGKSFEGASLKQLVAHPQVTHRVWRGLSIVSLAGHRVVYCWPDRQHLNDLWGVDADALVVVEWNEHESSEWINDANPIRLGGSETTQPSSEFEMTASERLPGGIEEILEYVAEMAAGYSSGLKWNEEDKLKADMMNRPERWERVTVGQVRARCRELGMRPKDVDTISGLLQHRKDGRRFNVRTSYRTFSFN